MRNPLHAICPYFAMFPETFAEEHISGFSSPGDYVLDPFSGRGTTLLQALLMGRRAVAIDINPVAYCVTGAKAAVPSLDSILGELATLELKFVDCSYERLREERFELPPFFRRAFHPTTHHQILFLRRILNWRQNPTHRFIAALALGSLHGDSPSYFSNQMPRTISTKPRYSLRYWHKHRLWPKKRDVFTILRQRAAYRLNKDVPDHTGHVALCDVRKAALAFPFLCEKVKAVITSPPYFNVTSYEEDQWLRLWFLGHYPQPTYRLISQDDRHEIRGAYWEFLKEAWAGIAPLLRKNTILVCRLGATGMGKDEIEEGLTESVRRVFPGARGLAAPVVSQLRNRQTDTFRPGSRGCLFEVDFSFDLRNN